MSGRDKTCTVCGMEPAEFPDGCDLSMLLERLEEEIRRSCFRGYTVFQTGMEMGADIWAAGIVLKLKEDFKKVRLVCYLPCETQADDWSDAWRDKYFNTLAKADDVITLQTRYSEDCRRRRNRKMIESSSRLIAVHDGSSSGDIAETISLAQKHGLEIVTVNPLECMQPIREVITSLRT